MRVPLLTLALLGCASDPEDSDTIDTWQAPDTEGAWPAGTEAHDIVGSTGVDLTLQLWFPATHTGTGSYRYDDLVEGEALEDGVADCTEPRPVAVFSHGNGGLRYQSWFLTEHLARHGYLVVAPGHTGNTTFDLDSIPRPEMAIRRPQDVADAFDWLVSEVQDPDSRLYGCAVPDDGYAIVGHSFGGYTTLAVAGAPLDLEALTTWCASYDDFLCGAETAWADANPGDDSGDLSDPRAWAAVPLAPAGRLSLGGGLPEIAIPTLVIGGLIDDVTIWESEVKPIYEALSATPRALAGLADVGHYTFTDFCVSDLNGCGAAALDLDRAQGIIRALTLAWLDVARGESRSADWLPVSDEAVVWEAVAR